MDDDLDFQSDFSVKMSISKRERDWFLSSMEPVVAAETFLICLTFFLFACWMLFLIYIPKDEWKMSLEITHPIRVG